MTFFIPCISFCLPSVSLQVFCQFVSSRVFQFVPVCDCLCARAVAYKLVFPKFKFCSTHPAATQASGPSRCDLHRPTIKTWFYRGCYCTTENLLLLDKGEHVNKESEAV